MSYANFKIGDYVTAQYIGGNQRNISYDKEYEVINVYKSDWTNQIMIRNDAGVKKWFRGDKGHTMFKLVTDAFVKPKNRYFHVSFSHQSGFGSIQYVVKNGKFPTIKELKAGFSGYNPDGNCIILNIIELSEQDFLDFISET